jgi:Domain of unknown function (DUF4864)
MLERSLKSFATAFMMLLLSWSMATPLRAASDKDEIRTVIEAQLNAFAVDDGEKAFSYAAPFIKQLFKTSDQFLAMVKSGYQPVYRNSHRVFGEVFQDGLGRPAMRVILTAMDGKRYEALYAMEKQADGQWKISSCTILVIPAQEV